MKKKTVTKVAKGFAMQQQNAAANGAVQYIRAAEKFMTDGRYTLALEQLGLAQRLDPANQYIKAIKERAESLRDSNRTRFPLESEYTLTSGHYLSVTVGSEFESGIRVADEDEGPEQIRLRVRQLTDTAQILLNRGLHESAFESLMKAYLLDPMSPDVLACEQRVLPAWEQTKAQRGTATLSPDDTRRLEALLRDKKVEQLEKDRTLWRKASHLDTPDGPAVQERSTRSNDEPTGFFQRLRKR